MFFCRFGIRHSLVRFGISVRECKVTLESLLAESLPHPALAVDWPEVLSENWNLLNQRYPLSEGQNQCYFATSSRCQHFYFVLSFCILSFGL